MTEKCVNAREYHQSKVFAREVIIQMLGVFEAVVIILACFLPDLVQSRNPSPDISF